MSALSDISSCSPRTWGWTSAACAARCTCSPVPHARGDGPTFSTELAAIHHLFPTHVGMDLLCYVHALPGLPLFPTHVGMDRYIVTIARH